MPLLGFGHKKQTETPTDLAAAKDATSENFTKIQKEAAADPLNCLEPLTIAANLFIKERRFAEACDLYSGATGMTVPRSEEEKILWAKCVEVFNLFTTAMNAEKDLKKHDDLCAARELSLLHAATKARPGSLMEEKIVSRYMLAVSLEKSATVLVRKLRTAALGADSGSRLEQETILLLVDTLSTVPMTGKERLTIYEETIRDFKAAGRYDDIRKVKNRNGEYTIFERSYTNARYAAELQERAQPATMPGKALERVYAG